MEAKGFLRILYDRPVQKACYLLEIDLALVNKFEQIMRHFKPGYSRPREQMVVEGMAATSLPISKQLCELANQERIPCVP